MQTKYFLVCVLGFLIIKDATCGRITENENQKQQADIISEKVRNALEQAEAETKNEHGIIAGVYNRIYDGVATVHHKIHDVILGEDSDPNKGIIRTLYERAKNRLGKIKTAVFGSTEAVDVRDVANQEAHSENDQVINLLFRQKDSLFNSEQEKAALESLRKKLTEAGDGALQLAADEKSLIQKAYESIRNKGADVKNDIHKRFEAIGQNINEGVDKTQNFLHDAKENVEQKLQSGIDNSKSFF